jgi:hypothetical protein
MKIKKFNEMSDYSEEEMNDFIDAGVDAKKRYDDDSKLKYNDYSYKTKKDFIDASLGKNKTSYKSKKREKIEKLANEIFIENKGYVPVSSNDFDCLEIIMLGIEKGLKNHDEFRYNGYL